MDFDWRGLEAAIRAQITGFVRQIRAEHPDDTLYGAAVHEFYADGEVIMWTAVGVASEETVDEDVRWSPADWEWQLDPAEAELEWARRLTAAATAGDWDAVHEKYLSTVVEACTAARHELAAEMGEDFLVVAMDEAWELVPRSLTEAQLRRHFPELDEQRHELARLAALPALTRAAELITLVDTPAAVNREQARELLREIGAAVVPLVLARLAQAPEKWRWAMLLAELGVADDTVIDALVPVLTTRSCGSRTARGPPRRSPGSAGWTS